MIWASGRWPRVWPAAASPARTTAKSSHDTRLLRRASRSIAAQVAVAVAVVVLVMGGAVFYAQERQQQSQATRIARNAWASADDVGDPPAGVWLLVATTDGRMEVTPGAPAAVRSLDPRMLPDGMDRTERDDRELVVWSGDRAQGRITAVYDLSPREYEERRLFVSLGLAALLGIAGALLVGAVIGRRAVRPLGAALALQRRFVADASHELRTPLSVLRLRAQLLTRRAGASLSPDDRRELDRLVQDTQKLADVVNDLLLSAELEHRPAAGQPVDLRAVADEVVHSLQPLAVQRSVELTMVAPGDAGTGSAGGLIVNGAEAALRRALVSLVDNALAHTSAGGHVRVEVARREGRIVVAVRDDGQGLDPDQAGQLVARFARGTASDQGRRFGLGLALVDEVARAHGGSLEITGQRGQGAVFSLRVPAST